MTERKPASPDGQTDRAQKEGQVEVGERVMEGIAGPAGTDLPGRAWSEGERSLLEDWHRRVSLAQHAHYFLMTRFRRMNVRLGIPVVVLSGLAGTTVFASLVEDSGGLPVLLQVVVGLLSVAAAVLAAVQQFLKYAERAEKHGVAADWFSAIRRDIEQVRASPEGEGEPQERLKGIRQEINRVVQTTPEIGEDVWLKMGGDDPGRF
jgi:hypothetical protein